MRKPQNKRRKARIAAGAVLLALAVGGCNTSRTHTGSIARPAATDPCAGVRNPAEEIDCTALASYGAGRGEAAAVNRPSQDSDERLHIDPALRTASAADFKTPANTRNGPSAQSLGLRGSAASPATTGSVQRRRERPRDSGGRMTLAQAISMAVRQNPEIGYQDAKTYDAYHGVRVAQSQLMPRIDGSLGVGYRVDGTWTNDGADLYKDGSGADRAAFDASIQLKQLLYDFGSTRRDIDRARFLYVMEQFKRQAKVEDIVFETITAYLSLLEQQKLLNAARDNLRTHEDFERLVRLNEANGNGTVADVNRVVARKIDAQTLLTDLEANAEDAADRFRRLTRMSPGSLANPPSVDRAVPPSLDAAIAMLPDHNPVLLGIRANTAASEMELASHRAAGMPTVNLEVDGTSQNYMDNPGTSELELKGMVMLRQRLFDGGRRRSENEQIRSRVRQHQYRYQNEIDDQEADLRQFYRAIRSSRAKVRDLQLGLESSRKVRELYTEQFRAGERTVFELLDSQTSLFSDERDLITNRYEALRAQFRILRAVGMLSQTVHAAPR